MFSHLKLILGIALAFPLFATCIVNCQQNETNKITNDFAKLTYLLPRKYKTFEVKSEFALMFTRLPIDWVETPVDIPIFQIGARIGMPAGFTIDGSLQTVVVSNQLRLGPHWNVSLWKFSASLGIDGGFLYGNMPISGFNNEASGWCAYPNISLGLNTGGVAFTLTGELNILFSLKITSGEAEISQQKNLFAGRTLALYMEQRLWKNHIMALGLISNFHKFYYPAWPAFSTFKSLYYVPQFYIGFGL